MSNADLEKRVETLEKELSQLKRRFPNGISDDWRKTVGMFDDDAEFEDILRLGSEYRRSQQEPDG